MRNSQRNRRASEKKQTGKSPWNQFGDRSIVMPRVTYTVLIKSIQPSLRRRCIMFAKVSVILCCSLYSETRNFCGSDCALAAHLKRGAHHLGTLTSASSAAEDASGAVWFTRTETKEKNETNVVVTCEITLFWNNFEIILVFYFRCNHRSCLDVKLK